MIDYSKIIAIDFDNTCVVNAFPHVGKDIPYCVSTLMELINNDYLLMLFTCRCDITDFDVLPEESGLGLAIKRGNYLSDAINWFKSKNIPLFAINKFPGIYKKSSPKPHFELLIDDKSLGIPLIPYYGENVVDWLTVRSMLSKRKYL
jgi:hypothetical protein